MSAFIIHECLDDLHDVVEGVYHVVVPDWLDELDELDWEALDKIRAISKLLHDTVMLVADHYRRDAERRTWMLKHSGPYDTSETNGHIS